MTEISIDQLKEAVENMYNCTASFRDKVYVDETFEGERVWQGGLCVFDLEGHPKAKTCYAWSSPVEGSDKRRFYTVLEVPPVASAVDAVRASIVSDYREEQDQSM
ncbi:MAG: hypothetical protein ACC700_20310 [Anaerolineales bacterium]